MPAETPRPRWLAAIPNLIGWGLSLAITWYSGWTTTDLVWSLWLSSLVVGYALIVWTIVEPTLELGAIGWQHRTEVEAAMARTSRAKIALGIVAVLVVGVFFLGFFTLHFGGFHYVHSQFLISMFPIDGKHRVANMTTYVEVARRYWVALPSAFLAERAAFLQRTFTPSKPVDVSVTPATIAARKAASAHLAPSRLTEPYARVIRMHMLIIALGFLHAVRLESFPIYAGVYALYFFPWRLLAKPAADPVMASASYGPTASPSPPSL